MSGSGSNIRRLLEMNSPPFRDRVHFQRPGRRQKATLKKSPMITACLVSLYDIRRFHQMRGLQRSVATSQGLAAPAGNMTGWRPNS